MDGEDTFNDGSQSAGALGSPPSTPPENVCAMERLRRDLREERLPSGIARDVGTVLELAEIGWSWQKDSSLEKWFPFTARELDELKALKAANAEICGGGESKHG